MTRDGQKALVLETGLRVLQEIAAEIDRGEREEDRGIPADWDGHELREYMAVKFGRQRSDRMQSSRTLSRKFTADLINRSL
jgi:hypothetical protein